MRRRGLAVVVVGAVGVAAAVGLAAVALKGGASVETASGAERRGPAGVAVAFRDVAADVGLDFRHGAFRFGVSADPVAMTGGGLCWLDYDGDGRLDLYVVNGFAEADRAEWLDRGGLPTSRLYRNVGRRFVDVTAESGAGLAARGQGCVAADLDDDGHTDLFVTTAEFPALLWNEGDGTFTEGAEDAGVRVFGWHAGIAAGDLDRDGRTDLVVTGYADLNAPVEGATTGFPGTFRGRRDLLFLNEGGGGGGGRATFREAGAEAGLEVVRFEHGLGVVLSDLDADGDLDVYVANDGDPNRLYEHVPWPGGAAADPAGLGFRFEERAASAGAADPGSGMGVAAGDYDGDGRPDLFVTNARRQVHAAYRSAPPGEADPSFVDVRAELGVPLSGSTGWGASWADVDNDTDLDLLLANGNVPVSDLAADAQPLQLLANRSAEGRPGRFETVPLGLPPLLARGSAAGDYDDDGDVDLAVVTVGGRVALLENTGTRGNWLQLRLRGGAAGAVVTVTLPGGRRVVREARAGGSFLSSEDPRVHVGLGAARRVPELVVRWPGGGEMRLEDVAANRIVTVEAP